MSTDWPYAKDGVERDEFAESLRIPLIGNPYPYWCYITAVVVRSDQRLWAGARPTDDELRVVASYHDEYCAHWYGDNWFRRQMAERPFDIDGGANGRVLIKYQHGGWAYRHASWRVGPTFWPMPGDEPMGLVAVLDHEKWLGRDRWERWKADHAEVFATVTR